MQKIINRTPADWGLFTGGTTITNYCRLNVISPNIALATFADDLNSRFRVLAHTKSWKDISYDDVDSIVSDWAEFGADDSEGYTTAAELLVELFKLTGDDAKTAFRQYRFPAN